MALVHRKPYKTIKLATAMQTLDVSRTTINRYIAQGRLAVANDDSRGRTTPKRVYAAQVNELAKELGLA